MEFWVICIAIVFYISIEKKVKKVNRKIKKLEKIKGDESMSKLIKDLVGKKCTILRSDDVVIGKLPVYDILDVDDEWVKVTTKDKKNNVYTRIIRIDDIHCINLVD